MDKGEEGGRVKCERCPPPEMGGCGVWEKIELRTGEVVAILQRVRGRRGWVGRRVQDY